MNLLIFFTSFWTSFNTFPPHWNLTTAYTHTHTGVNLSLIPLNMVWNHPTDVKLLGHYVLYAELFWYFIFSSYTWRLCESIRLWCFPISLFWTILWILSSFSWFHHFSLFVQFSHIDEIEGLLLESPFKFTIIRQIRNIFSSYITSLIYHMHTQLFDETLELFFETSTRNENPSIE